MRNGCLLLHLVKLLCVYFIRRFFSLGYDVKDHYKELGGDAAAYVAAVFNPYSFVLVSSKAITCDRPCIYLLVSNVSYYVQYYTVLSNI